MASLCLIFVPISLVSSLLSLYQWKAVTLTWRVWRTSPNFTLAVSKLFLFTLDFTAATPFVMRLRPSRNFSLLKWYSASNIWWLFTWAFPFIISLMAARKLIADSEDEQAFTKDSADSGPGYNKLISCVKSHFPICSIITFNKPNYSTEILYE